MNSISFLFPPKKEGRGLIFTEKFPIKRKLSPLTEVVNYIKKNPFPGNFPLYPKFPFNRFPFIRECTVLALHHLGYTNQRLTVLPVADDVGELLLCPPQGNMPIIIVSSLTSRAPSSSPHHHHQVQILFFFFFLHLCTLAVRTGSGAAPFHLRQAGCDCIGIYIRR